VKGEERRRLCMWGGVGWEERRERSGRGLRSVAVPVVL